MSYFHLIFNQNLIFNFPYYYYRKVYKTLNSSKIILFEFLQRGIPFKPFRSSPQFFNLKHKGILKLLGIGQKLCKVWKKSMPGQILNSSSATSWCRYSYLDFNIRKISNHEVYGPRFAHLSTSDILYIQMPWNILPVLHLEIEHKSDCAIRKIKDHPNIIIWANLVDPESSMLYTKIQPQSFFGSAEKEFKCFYHISEWRPSCSRCRSIWTNCQNPFDRKPHLKSGEIFVNTFQRRSLKITRFSTYIYID